MGSPNACCRLHVGTARALVNGSEQVKVMRYSVLFLVPFILGIQISYGEAMYVTEDLAVMARTSPNPKGKIIGMPKSGTQVELLEVRDDGWSYVKLPNEKEGWVLSRFLDSGQPSAEVIDKLRRENRTLVSQTETLSEENTVLKRKREELEKTLSELTRTADDMRESYEALKTGSREYLALKASYENAIQELSSKTKQASYLEGEVAEVRNDRSLRWFTVGSSVILVGFILGLVYGGKPKRKSYLR